MALKRSHCAVVLACLSSWVAIRNENRSPFVAVGALVGVLKMCTVLKRSS